MRFEERKFCQMRTLAERWDCSVDRLYDLLSTPDVPLRAWHPLGQVGKKGMMIDVASALETEARGYVIMRPEQTTT